MHFSFTQIFVAVMRSLLSVPSLFNVNLTTAHQALLDYDPKPVSTRPYSNYWVNHVGPDERCHRQSGRYKVAAFCLSPHHPANARLFGRPCQPQINTISYKIITRCDVASAADPGTPSGLPCSAAGSLPNTLLTRYNDADTKFA